MRAAFSIYEHPQLTDSQVWSKNSPTKTTYTAVVAVGILVSSLAAYHYTSLRTSAAQYRFVLVFFLPLLRSIEHGLIFGPLHISQPLLFILCYG